MTGPTVLSDGSTIIMEPIGKTGGEAEAPVSEETTPSVYAAYWQARSGLINLAPKAPQAQTDLGSSGR